MGISQVTDHSSSSSGQPPYEVFLSFRGPDMRRGFADFLYTMLIDVGIHVFRNEEELERVKEIYPQPIQAIRQSKISIPVISREYASSNSCLLELKQMVECMDKKNHFIIPIFYYVDASDVRDCSGPFERALDEHKKRDRDGRFIDRWMSALRRIGELQGHQLHEKSEVSHGEVVKQIVHQVQQKLKKQDLIVTKQLVGVDSHVQGIMAKLMVDYRNGEAVKIADTSVKVLGIYGIPGVGKTVLAKYVYNQLYHLFDACSFLGEIQAEIRHKRDIVPVQNKLISDLDKGNAKKFDSSEEALFHIRNNFCNMKVLVLLDDVYDHEQLSALVGELDWLGPGSRVILTSQTQDVLRNIDGAESFVLEPMKQDEALILFCRHAFGTDSPREEFEELSRDILAATGGLPLALEVIGSSLFLVKSKKAWRETLTALKVAPHKRVQAALEKSYTNLDENERQIFLDIACFFIGMDKRIPYYMWDDCKYSPSRSIRALHARSLIEIGEDKELLMHDILEKFGREIVKNENRYEPFKRSRLCDHEEALHVLKRREGTEKVEALRLKFDDSSEGNIRFECDQFDGLQNLRFLKLDQADIRGNFRDRLSNLRWLHWQGCPKIFDNQSLNLNVQNLVILDLSWSEVHKDWGGWKLLVEARKLKVLKLTGCFQLTATPEFPPSMELERLILENCYNLEVIHPSVSNLEKLVSLNMKRCGLHRELPDLGPMRNLEELVIDETSISRINFQKDSMVKLKTLSAHDCEDLTGLSDLFMSSKSLEYLNLDGTRINTVHFIRSLQKLKKLSLKNCQDLRYLLDVIGNLRSLQFLDLSSSGISRLPKSIGSLEELNTLSLESCKGLVDLPDEIGNLRSLQFLDLSDSGIYTLPESIGSLEKLNTLDLRNCERLSDLPNGIWNLRSLQFLDLSSTGIQTLPESIRSLEELNTLSLRSCKRLSNLPDGIGNLRSLQFLDLSDSRFYTLPKSIGLLEELNTLDLNNCKSLFEVPDEIGNLRSLQSLDLSGSAIYALPNSIGSLEKLNTLSLKSCERLVDLPDGIGNLRSLQFLDLSRSGIKSLPESIGSLEKLNKLSLEYCHGLSSLPDGIGNLRSLQFLNLSDSGIQTLPESTGSLEELNTLSLNFCSSLSNLPDGIGNLRSLQFLGLSSSGIKTLPGSIGSLEKLTTLSLFNCKRLSDLPDGIGNLRSLQFLHLSSTGIKTLPGSIGSLEKLTELSLFNCKRLSDLPDGIGNLRSLQFLDLSDSGIYTLPESIGSLEKLNRLSLRSCSRLSDLPDEIGNLSSLQFLDLSDSIISTLPESIGSLEKLNTLSLRSCSRLSNLPDEIGNLTSLQFLDLSDSIISTLPESIGSLEKLNTLSLRSCKRLSNLPDGIGNLRSLQFLDLSDSIISTLPESIGSLEKLNTLDLKSCKRLSNLPDGIGNLRSLEFLDLSDTPIRELPPSVKDLKAMKLLKMRGTFIREFPEAILNLEKLEEIDFSSCGSLEGRIPDDIWRLTSLAVLKLSNTMISGLPASISRLSHLRKLDTSGCHNLQNPPKLPRLDTSVWDNLQSPPESPSSSTKVIPDVGK